MSLDAEAGSGIKPTVNTAARTRERTFDAEDGAYADICRRGEPDIVKPFSQGLQLDGRYSDSIARRKSDRACLAKLRLLV